MPSVITGLRWADLPKLALSLGGTMPGALAEHRRRHPLPMRQVNLGRVWARREGHQPTHPRRRPPLLPNRERRASRWSAWVPVFRERRCDVPVLIARLMASCIAAPLLISLYGSPVVQD